VSERLALQRVIGDAVTALDEPYRTMILLRFYDGIPPREIARRLEIPVDTVKSRLRRGLGQLRAALDRAHGGDRGVWSALLLPLAGWRTVPGAAAGGSTGAAGGVSMTEILAMSNAKIAGLALLIVLAAAGAWIATSRARIDRAPRGDDRVAGAALGLLDDESPGSGTASVPLDPGSDTGAATRQPVGSQPAAGARDAAALPLGRGGSLTVRVRANSGEPAAACTVVVAWRSRLTFDDGTSVGRGIECGSAASDDSGRVEFSALPAGTYAVTAKDPAWAAGEALAEIPQERPGAHVVLDLSVEPMGALSGRWEDARGRPLPGFARRRTARTGSTWSRARASRARAATGAFSSPASTCARTPGIPLARLTTRSPTPFTAPSSSRAAVSRTWAF
jgi:hypothetical protein